MNKKAVSIMIGYVLLIIIAVAVSVLVYGFLKAYVPKEKPECEKELALIIEDVKINCDSSNVPQSIDVTVNNRGLFKMDAVFIRLEKEGRRVKKFINDPLVDNNYAEDFYLQDNGNPGQTFIASDLDISEVYEATEDQYELEVQPAHFTGKGLELALCTPISQTIPIICPTT